MEHEALVSGTFSCVGRTTGRGVDKLRSGVEKSDSDYRAVNAQRVQKAKAAVASPTVGRKESLSEPVSSPIAAGAEDGKNALKDAVTKLDVIRALSPKAKHAMGLPHDPDGPAPSPKAKDPIKEDPIWRSEEADKNRYDNNSGVLYGRFVKPQGPSHVKPPVGHYTAQHDSVKDRNPKWDFGRTVGRNKPKKLDDTASSMPDLSKSRDNMNQTRSTIDPGALSGTLGDSDTLIPSQTTMQSVASPSSLSRLCIPHQQMGLTTPHKDLAMMGAVAPGRMWTEAPQFCGSFYRGREVVESPEHLGKQIMNTSHMTKQPEWDFEKLPPRANPMKKSFFEPGKYKIKWESPHMSSLPKSGVNHADRLGPEVMSRARSSACRPMLLEPETVTPKKGIVMNRSTHRDTALTRMRVTHVQEMGLVKDRPPFFAACTQYHDEDDPEVDAKVMEYLMTVDKSHVDDYVVARHDHHPDMVRAMNRDKSGVGHRLFQDSRVMRSSKGFRHPDVSVEELPVEDCKENPNRLRPDKGLTMAGMSGRKKGTDPQGFLGEYINLSSLRKPRHMLADDFARHPALPGFAPRVTANIPQVLRENRSFKEMPGFDMTMFDDCPEALEDP